MFKKLQIALIAAALYAPCYAQDSSDGSFSEQLPVAVENGDVVKLENYCVDDIDDTELFARLEDKLELLVFTHKEHGVCRPCDQVEPIVKRLSKRYPITNVYVDRRHGREQMDDWGVRATPTFVLVRRDRDGNAEELDRLVGARRVGKWIVNAFEEADFNDVDDFKDRPRPDARPIPRAKPNKQPRKVSFWESIFGL